MLECLNIFLLSVKALVGYVGTFNKEKALVGAFFVILIVAISLLHNFSTLSSSKLGLAAGFSALSPPEMLFRTWGGGQGGHCTQRTRPRGVGADYKTVSTSQPDLSRLKPLTPARARRLGAEKTSPEKNNLGA